MKSVLRYLISTPTKRDDRKGKERALVERLEKLKASVCLFNKDFRVPFDNNQAECDVRNVKTKVAGCFRTENGAQDYLDIMPYISTGRKHGVSADQALTAALARGGKRRDHITLKPRGLNRY